MSLPLIAAQPGIWLADKLSTFDNAYTVVHYLDLTGKLDVETLCEAIMQAMHETDTLQMSYDELDGEVVQTPGGALPLPTPEVWDLRQDADPLRSSHELIQKDTNANVRIDSGNALIRHALLRVSDEKWLWYQRYHHVQLDAFSFTALTRRMVDLYSARIRGSQSLATQPFASSESVVKEYQDYEQSPKYNKDAKFWKEFCQSLPEAASFSSRPLNGEEPSKKILRNKIFLNKAAFKKVCEAGRQQASLQDADMALALISVWLLRLSNRDSMSTGFIFMRRLGSAALSSGGPFINVLPMPLSLVGSNGEDETLITLAATLAKTLRSMRRHQKYNSENIVRDSGRTWDDNPLYGPVINFKAFDYRLDFEGIECDTHHLASGPIRDIEIVLYVTGDGEVQVEYLANADRYDAQILNYHLERLPLLLDQFAKEPQTLKCSDAGFVLSEERGLIDGANSTEQQINPDDTLVSLLKKQIELSPDAIALEDVSTRLTYREMQQQVNALIEALLKRGVSTGDIIAVALPRSVLLSIALQAIISVGATWLPLDPSYPEERLKFMIEDSNPRILIADSSWPFEKDDRVMIFEKLRDAHEVSDQKTHDGSTTVSPVNIAYMIYTSGSTGRPKGVKISHKAIVNRLLWMQSEYGLENSDAVLQKTPSSFDVSVWEFFWPLISGARLFMAPPDAHRDPEELLKLIIEHNITTIHFVPSMMAAFLNGTAAGKVSNHLRRTFCSGEALPTLLAKKWEQTTGVQLFNLYGPTEAAIDVTAYPAFGEYLTSDTCVPIGRPVWNTQVHILDHEFRLLPSGMAGDLYISGVQLAECYLNRPELTEERFIWVNGTRMYRTGDVAQWIPGSNALEFLGRSDDQVKLRGQRIELGEIDSVLERLPGVSQAVTQPQVLLSNTKSTGEDSRQLIGYLVSNQTEPLDLDALHAQLHNFLPSYMVPVKLMALDSLPLSASGKLDRRALPLPSVGSATLERRAPSAGLEQIIAESFKELLGCEEDVSADDDFFSLGGHSLLAVRLAAVLRNKLQLPVTIGQIMQTPRVSSLAEKLGDESNRDLWQNAGFEDVLPLRSSDQGQKIFCLHPASGFSWQFSVLRRYLDPHWSLIGIQSAQPDGVLALSQTLEDVVESHFQTILSQQSEGRYYLLGYSLGGTLAHALAARLTNSGRTVAFLGLLDTWPPETQNWDEKRGKNVVDEAVIEEMYRERQQFVDAQQGAFDDDGMNNKLFDTIESNYTSAVRLLATAKSSRFEGKSTLFVAEKTFPAGTDLQQVWNQWTSSLEPVPVSCSHVDIISPGTFQQLGPQIDALLKPYIQ